MRSVGAMLVSLAWARRFRYTPSMLPLRLRRVISLALTLTLAVGLVAQGARAAGVTVKADGLTHVMAAHMDMAAAGSMPMCNKCDACKTDSCNGERCTSSAACSAYCGNLLTALPAFDPAIGTTICGTAANGPVPFRLGWDPAPDPYPPRTNILT